MKISTDSLHPSYSKPVLVVEQEPDIHFAEPHWMGEPVRLCDLGNGEGELVDNMDDVTCKLCRKRGAWLYGW